MIRPRDLRWITANATSPRVNDEAEWYQVLAFVGMSIPDYPADLLVLAAVEEET